MKLIKITLQVNLSPVSDVDKIKAKYLNSRLLTCKFPERNFYAVGVSNDGIRVSEYVNYIIYDSRCHYCNNSLCIARVRFVYCSAYYAQSANFSPTTAMAMCKLNCTFDLIYSV